jgi:hypothetical protein
LNKNIFNEMQNQYKIRSAEETDPEIIRERRRYLSQIYDGHGSCDRPSGYKIVNGIWYKPEIIDGRYQYVPMSVVDRPNASITEIEDRLDRMYEQIERLSEPAKVLRQPESVPEKKLDFRSVKADPHLFSPVLSVDALMEVIAWAHDISGTQRPDFYDLRLLSGDYPDTAAEIAAAAFATLTYGQNNYIGPSKTGLKGPLIQVVQAVPALNEADARARAHDIALTVSQDSTVDDVLPYYARWAQVARPYFPGSNVILTAPQPRREGDIETELIIGGIEPNPGPNYEFGKPKAVDDCIDIANNPVAASGELNAAVTSKRLDEYSYDIARGSFILRNGADTITDIVRPDDGWQMLSGWDPGIYVPGTTFRRTRRRARISFLNKEIKKALPLGTLGSGLSSALNVFSDFLAAERTESNVLNGDNHLGVQTRTSNLDYGMYVDLGKYFAYCNTGMMLSGDDFNNYSMDMMTKNNADIVPTPDVVWPMSDNLPWTAANLACDAVYMNFSTYVDCLRGLAVWPLGIKPNTTSRIAYRVYFPGMDAGLLCAIATLAFEYPVYGHDLPVIYTSTSAANGVPPQGVGSVPPVSMMTLIDGPRTVVFVGVGGQDLLGIVVGRPGVTTPLPAYVNGQIPVNISPSVIDYIDNVWCGNFTVPTDFSMVCDYWLRFMDIEDWRAALDLAGHIIQRKHPHYTYMAAPGVAAATPSIVMSNNGGLTMDASFNRVVIAPINDNDWPPLMALPTYNCSGMPDIANLVEVLANGNAQDVIATNIYVADSEINTYIGVGLTYLSKNTLTGKFLNMTRANYNRIWYAIRKISNIKLQCAHDFYSKFGTIHGYLHFDQATQKQLNIREKLLTALSRKWYAWQRAYTGWAYLTFPNPYPVNFDPGLSFNTPLFIYSAWRNGPLILHNDILQINDLDWRIAEKWRPLCNMSYAQIAPLELEAAESTGGQVHGVQLTNPTSVRITEVTKYGSTGMSQRVKSLFAALSMGDTINVGAMTRYLDSFMTIRASNRAYVVPPTLIAMKQWLRWTSADAPSDALRGQARPGRVLMTPVFPPQFDDLTGQDLSITFLAQATYYMISNKFQMNGFGSVNIGMTVSVLPPNISMLEDDNGDDDPNVAPAKQLIKPSAVQNPNPGSPPGAVVVQDPVLPKKN